MYFKNTSAWCHFTLFSEDYGRKAKPYKSNRAFLLFYESFKTQVYPQLFFYPLIALNLVYTHPDGRI